MHPFAELIEKENTMVCKCWQSTVRLCDPWGAAARDPPAGFGESKWDSSAHLLAAFCPQEIQNICPFWNVPGSYT